MAVIAPPIDVVPDDVPPPSNQPPPRVGCDEYADNVALLEAVQGYDAGWADERLHAAGRLTGSAQLQEWAVLANANPPELLSYDRSGQRVDEVRYHPAYHEIIARSVAAGTPALSWQQPRPGAQVARQALHMLFCAAESGHACPTTMTHAAVPALRAQPDVAAQWVPKILAGRYDPVLRPAADKSSVLIGMAMTEKQGGSDVRANTTHATPVNGAVPGAYLLNGHKWFCSAPMSDAFLVLAQTQHGVSCFLLPRVLPDGTRNGLQIVRLKDKLGNRSNASSEIELHDAYAQLIGEPGRGVRTIMEMVNLTRLDCAGGSAALMSRAVAEASWYAERRSAFGSRLLDQPLMAAVLADLAVEAEAATATVMRLAHAYDSDDDSERSFRRLATAVAKYWICKRGPAHAAEALECLGGNGYTETFPLARIYREQPLLSIWEGSGNVICLDVVRAVSRAPESLAVFLAEVDRARGADGRLDAYVDALRHELGRPSSTLVSPRGARVLVERLALALQGSLLVRHAPAAVADAFCASRLAGLAHEYGALPDGVDTDAILGRLSRKP